MLSHTPHSFPYSPGHSPCQTQFSPNLTPNSPCSTGNPGGPQLCHLCHRLWCYVYRLCLPLWTYLLTDKWVTVQKHLRTSLGTPLCILFRLLLTYWYFLTLLGRCTVHGTPLTEGSASTSTLDSCTVQETSMTDGSASEALQAVYCTVYCTWRRPWLMGDVLHSVLYMATPHRSYLYIR